MDTLTRRVYSLLPRVKLTDLLVEVDSWTAFTRQFTHLKSGRRCKDAEVLHAALLADGINLGPTKMAEATDDPRMTYERIAWASDWHIRDGPARGRPPNSSTTITACPSRRTGEQEPRPPRTASGSSLEATGTSPRRSTPATAESRG